MKIAAIIEARMSATRLPGKVMMTILGKPVLELIIERIKKVNLINEIVVATTLVREDNVIEVLCKKLRVQCFRGSNEDVLGRVLLAAKSIKADIIVEILADSPFVDAKIINKGLKLFFTGKYDYVANGCLKKTYPDGLGIQIYSIKTLEKVNRLTNNPIDREHVTYYIYKHPKRYRLGDFEATRELNWPELAITLDTKSDYRLIKIIFENLYPKNAAFSALDVVKFLRQNPKLILINENLERREIRLKNMPRNGTNEEKI